MKTPYNPQHRDIPQACFIFDQDLEANVLSLLLRSTKAVDFAAPYLKPELFYDAKHQYIAGIILKLLEDGETVSPVIVSAKITADSNRVATMGDVADLLSNYDPQQQSLLSMLKMLDKYRQCRDLVSLSMQMYQTGRELIPEQLDNDMDRLLEQFDRIRIGIETPIIQMQKCVDNNLQIIQDNLSPETRHTGLMTGFHLIDDAGGLPKGLTVLGAKTSHGKSAMAMAWAIQAAKSGMKVSYFSFEMENEELSARALAMETRQMRSQVSANMMMRLPLNAQQIASANEAAILLQNSGCTENLYLSESHSASYSQLEMQIRQMVNHFGVKAVFIDYLQTIEIPGRNGSTREELLGQISHKLHDLALKLKIQIVAISQMNRTIQGEPTMFQLRDSGQIAEAADCIAILWRPEQDHVDSYNAPHQSWPVKGTAILKMEKFRNGPTGDCLVRYTSHLTCFEDIPEGEIVDAEQTAQKELFSADVFK